MKTQSDSAPVPSRGLHIAVLAAVGCALALTLAQRGLLVAFSDGSYQLRSMLGVDVLLWFLWLPIAPVIVIAARRWTFRHTPVTDLAAHLSAAVVLAVLHTVVFRGLQLGLTGSTNGQPFLLSIAGLLTWRLAVDAFLYGTIVGITLIRETGALAPAADRPPSVSAKWHRNPNRPIAVVDGTRTILFEQHEVCLVEAADYYAKVHARGRVWLIRESLDALEARLASPPFFRAHRSAIVNVRFVTDLVKVSRHRHVAVLRDGARVAVSAERRGTLEELLVGVSERR